VTDLDFAAAAVSSLVADYPRTFRYQTEGVTRDVRYV
jgi:hypothetical protein